MKTVYNLHSFWTSMSAIFGFTFHIGRTTEVLTPDIYRAHWYFYFHTSVDEQDRTGGGEETYKTLVKLHPDGKCMWSSPALFKAICEIDVSYFPLDQQKCRLKFGSWTYNSNKLKLTSKEKLKFPTDDYIKNGEWAVYKVETRANDKFYDGSDESYMDVTMTIEMKRQYLDYMINLVIPCLMISCMTFLGE